MIYDELYTPLTNACIICSEEEEATAGGEDAKEETEDAEKEGEEEEGEEEKGEEEKGEEEPVE